MKTTRTLLTGLLLCGITITPMTALAQEAVVEEVAPGVVLPAGPLQVIRQNADGTIVCQVAPTPPAEQAANSLGTNDEFVREYAGGAILTKEQEKIVIELAQKCGIKKIAKIKTYYLLPSSQRGISVYGVEQVKGREVLQPYLNVTYKEWTSRNHAPNKDDLQSGDFWAGKSTTRKTTILMVGKKEYRVGSPHGLSVEQCESILQRCQTGKYTLAEGIKEDRLKRIDWNSPTSFSKFGENIHVSFSVQGGNSGWYSLTIKLTGDKLIINEVSLAMP